MRKKTLLVSCLVAALIAMLLACGSSNTGVKTGTSDATEPAPTPAIYATGDVIEVKDHTITLNSAEYDGKNLAANFTVENKGSEEITVSAMLSFEAKNGEGVILDRNIFDCDTSMNGSVMVGEKLKGDLCWKGGTAGTVRIYYKASAFGKGAIVWEITAP